MQQKLGKEANAVPRPKLGEPGDVLQEKPGNVDLDSEAGCEPKGQVQEPAAESGVRWVRRER